MYSMLFNVHPAEAKSYPGEDKDTQGGRSHRNFLGNPLGLAMIHILHRYLLKRVLLTVKNEDADGGLPVMWHRAGVVPALLQLGLKSRDLNE